MEQGTQWGWDLWSLHSSECPVLLVLVKTWSSVERWSAYFWLFPPWPLSMEASKTKVLFSACSCLLHPVLDKLTNIMVVLAKTAASKKISLFILSLKKIGAKVLLFSASHNFFPFFLFYGGNFILSSTFLCVNYENPYFSHIFLNIL